MSTTDLRLSTRVRGVTPYATPAPAGPIDLWLDANEGPAASIDLYEIARALPAGAMARYPSPRALEARLAQRWGVEPSRVLVTSGGDDAIDRACRAVLEPGRELILPVPTFEMIRRFATLAGARTIDVPWPDGPYPTQRVLEQVSAQTSMIALVSPNNPTGAAATADDLRRVAAGAPAALVLVDAAYAEFADEDLTQPALALPNTLVVRTFSKALGLAGLRVGYCVGPAELIRAMRAAGGPFPVSALSLLAAERAVDEAPRTLARVVPRIRQERVELSALLSALGATAAPSQGNFVLARFSDADWAWRALASQGIAVRRFASDSALGDRLRITLPGDGAAFARLCAALSAALRPEALLLDMDGVIADVSGSYRAAIRATAASFGVEVTAQDVAAAKAAGDANNDWVLTQRLLASRGVAAPLDEVTRRFEAMYLGTPDAPGLEARERLIPPANLLRRLASRLPLAIVTGRPRRDCERFLRRFGLEALFPVRVCMEDGPPKPRPDVVRRALADLGVARAWMVGDTPDDIVAARGAGVIPVGISAPGEASPAVATAMATAGAARILSDLTDLERMLP